jgi:hypothetical protein
MSKLSKAESARINGAKSRGPITPEGKERSSKNALRHGLAAESLPLINESRERFAAMLADYVEVFQPANAVEEDLVEDMVDNRWRKRRAVGIYNAALDLQMSKDRAEVEKLFNKIDGETRQAIAMTNLCKSTDLLRNLHRYESTAVRGYFRAMNMLLKLQAARRKEEEEVQEAEAEFAPSSSPRPKLVPVFDKKSSQNEPTAPGSDSPRKEKN